MLNLNMSGSQHGRVPYCQMPYCHTAILPYCHTARVPDYQCASVQGARVRDRPRSTPAGPRNIGDRIGGPAISGPDYRAPHSRAKEVEVVFHHMRLLKQNNLKMPKNIVAKLQIKPKSKSNQTKNLERLYIWVVVCSVVRWRKAGRNAGYNRLIPF